LLICSPSHITNFFSVISGVEKVSEWVDMYSSVADLPLKIFIDRDNIVM
jgi:hypothetical protein